MTYDFELHLNVDKIVRDMGLEEKGRVQQFVTNEVLNQSEPFIPFDEAGLYDNPGALVGSGRIEGTDVVWSTPYARHLYYHPEFNFQGAPQRGGYWVDRMLQEGGLQQIEKGIKRLTK